MSYSIELVPGFLLHDGISWCRKNNRKSVKFFRNVDGVREEVTATPAMILAEIIRRQDEGIGSIHCVSCGSYTDGRSYFLRQEPLCEPCYWAILLGLHSGRTPTPPTQNGGKGIPLPGVPTRGKVIMLPAVQTEQLTPHEETPEEIAARLGVSLDVLQANGYFD